MPLSTNPTEEPQSSALLNAARHEAGANDTVYLQELTYDGLKTPGALNIGDTLIIHRALERDVKRGAATTLRVQIMDITPTVNGKGPDAKTIVSTYNIGGEYMKAGADSTPIMGTMLLTREDKIQIIQPEEGLVRRSGPSETAYTGFQFSSSTDPIRIYVKRMTPQSPVEPLALEPTIEAAPPAPELAAPQSPTVSPEVASPVGAMRRALGGILSALRGRNNSE